MNTCQLDFCFSFSFKLGVHPGYVHTTYHMSDQFYYTTLLEASVVSHLLVFFHKTCFWFQLFFSLQNHNTLIHNFTFFFQCFALKQKLTHQCCCHVLHPQLQVLKFGTLYIKCTVKCIHNHVCEQINGVPK